MLSTRWLQRFYHTSKMLSAEKSALATLRKKTGYTIANCKKALQLHNNNLEQAEEWLQKQAQDLGWKKASKLEGRTTLQGLIGVIVKDPCAALVEINCETDFVARNKEFQNMAKVAAESCLNYTLKQIKPQLPLTKVCFSGEQLKDLHSSDGKRLADLMALMIGNLGENATLRRSLCFRASPGIQLSGYAHPPNPDLDMEMGKFGGILAFRQLEQKDVNLETAGKQLCQHIVGMNPKRIGKLGKEAENETKEEEEEDRLLYQDFLHDDSILVKDFLSENGIEVIDFERFECGETIKCP